MLQLSGSLLFKDLSVNTDLILVTRGSSDNMTCVSQLGRLPSLSWTQEPQGVGLLMRWMNTLHHMGVTTLTDCHTTQVHVQEQKD